VTFSNFTGLELLKPESGTAYDVEVPPGGNKTMILRCDPEGYSMSSSTATQVVHGDSQLIQMCLTQGKKTGRPDTETQQDHGIAQYSLQHGGGIAYLYDNKSTKMTLDEEIEFEMQGLEIEGMPGETTTAFTVPPG